MVELDVKITSGDLYDFLLRHSYNSVSGLLGAVIGALGVIVGISRPVSYTHLTLPTICSV